MSSIAGGDLINGSAYASPFLQAQSVTQALGNTPGSVLNIAGSNISVGGSAPVANQALVASSASAASFANVVNSVSFSGTGLTPSSASTGAIGVSGTLNVAHGGTGAATLTGVLIGNGTSAVTASAQLPLASGGTNANLTAVNGGLVWSDASKLNILAAGVSGQVLTSNGAAAPSWSVPVVVADLGQIGTVAVGTGTTTVSSITLLNGTLVQAVSLCQCG